MTLRTPSPRITLEQQRHLAEPAQEAAAPLDLVRRHREPQVRVAPDQRLEGDLPLDAGQRRAQTDVDPLAEGDVAVGVSPADVEGVRIGKALGVAIGAGQTDRNLLPLGDRRVRDRQVLRWRCVAR